MEGRKQRRGKWGENGEGLEKQCGDVKKQTGGIGKDLPILRNILTTTVFKYPNDMMTITIFKYPNDMMTITIFKYP